MFVGVLFLILSIIFFISGFILIRALHKDFTGFYEIIKLKIWLATILLSAPLMARGIFNILRYF
jgi:hypothetical protein